MSFEIFLQCFGGGSTAGLSRNAVKRLFPVIEHESEPNYWKVLYGKEDWCNIALTPSETHPELVEGLCAFRPCGDLRFWESILEVMRLGSVTLFFPGDAPPLVASQFASEQVPLDIIESIGRPRVVRSADEILEIIRVA